MEKDLNHPTSTCVATFRHIVVKTDQGTTVWQRKEDGTLYKVNIITRREEDIIGTHAWKVKHGFSIPRKR